MVGDGDRLAPGDRAPARSRPGPRVVRDQPLHSPEARRGIPVPGARSGGRSARLLPLHAHRLGLLCSGKAAGSAALRGGRALFRKGGRLGPALLDHGEGRPGEIRGRHRRLEHVVAVSQRAPHFLGTLGWALATAGRKEEARRILEELRARPPGAPAVVSEAWLLGALGEIDAAFEVVARAEEECQAFLYFTGLARVRFSPRRSEIRSSAGKARASARAIDSTPHRSDRDCRSPRRPSSHVSRRREIRTGRSSSTIMVVRAAGSRQRLFASSASKNRLRFVCVDRPGIGQSSPQETRTYSGWADDLITVAEHVGVRRIRSDGLVGRRPVGACGRGLHRSRSACATSAASRVEATERSGTTGQRSIFRKPTRSADFSHCISSPACASCTRPLVSPPNTSAGPTSRNCGKPSTTPRRPADPARAGFRNRFLRSQRRMFRSGERRARSRQRAPLSALGFRREGHRAASPHVARNG